MAFVFSSWIIVAVLLAVGIAACIAVFFVMDKRDKVIVENFIKESSEQTPVEVQPAEEAKSNE